MPHREGIHISDDILRVGFNTLLFGKQLYVHTFPQYPELIGPIVKWHRAFIILKLIIIVIMVYDYGFTWET